MGVDWQNFAWFLAVWGGGLGAALANDRRPLVRWGSWLLGMVVGYGAGWLLRDVLGGQARAWITLLLVVATLLITVVMLYREAFGSSPSS